MSGLSALHDVVARGEFRGRTYWVFVLSDEFGRAEVTGYGVAKDVALADARVTFAMRRIWTDEERASFPRPGG